MFTLAFSVPFWTQLVQLIGGGLRGLFEITGDAGIAIILFTLFVKTLFIPLTLPALRNSRRQQELSPMVREIMKKHGKDRQAASAEQMALYRQYGFNPVAGCLPSLVQIPFFFALWRALVGIQGTPMGNDSFLWIPQIAGKDPLYILIVGAAVAQFFQTRMAMQPRNKVVDAQQKQMNTIMQFMPLMVIVFGLQVPAGAVLYWIVSSLFSAVQQYFVTGWGSLRDLFPFLPAREPRSLLGPPRDPSTIKPGRFAQLQQRMLEAQEQQQAAKSQGNAPVRSAVPAEPARRQPQAQVAIEDVSPEGNQLTQDGWRLPGAPGTTGRTAFAAGGAGGGNAGQPKPSGAARQQRPNGNNRSKKKRR